MIRRLLCLLGFHNFETVWTFQNDFWFDWNTGRAKSTTRCKHCGKGKTR